MTSLSEIREQRVNNTSAKRDATAEDRAEPTAVLEIEIVGLTAIAELLRDWRSQAERLLLTQHASTPAAIDTDHRPGLFRRLIG